MNSKLGFRKVKGGFLRATAGAAVLIVVAICTTLRAGSAMAATGSGAPSASSAQPAMAGASVSLASMALTVGGTLVALMAVVLTVDYSRRRIARRRAGGRRGGTHARASTPRDTGALESITDLLRLNRPAGSAEPSESEDEYPSWPGPPGPYALHPDHPSWPGRPDPRWAGTEATLREEDYPSWPEPEGPPWLDAAPPVPENGGGGSPGDTSGARPELALPTRVRRDFVPGANPTPGTDPAP